MKAAKRQTSGFESGSPLTVRDAPGARSTLRQGAGGRSSPVRWTGTVRAFAAVLCAALSSCSLTPQERLHGRWYNADMSVRFRPDGGVLFNSRAGRAVGRYVYETSAPAAADQRTTNLVLDVVRNGEPLRLEFDARLLSRDRLRLQASRRRSAGRARDGTAATVVLQRATGEDVDPIAEQDVVTALGPSVPERVAP
jgi:hypothetical protein